MWLSSTTAYKYASYCCCDGSGCLPVLQINNLLNEEIGLPYLQE